MEIGFYHLTRSTLQQALPRLLARVLAIPARAMVLSGAAERLEALDTVLWADAEWLPHGSPATGDAALQPIWLTSEDGAAPNDAAHLFLVDGAESAHLEHFQRGFDLFDGNDENALEAARERWKRAKAAGHALTYWQQGEKGWERKA
jgi:DNA polymerase-3 subunit chi